MSHADGEPIGLRLQAAVYLCGIFSSGTSNLIWVVVPLWAVMMGASPMMIGLALGAYTFLPLLLSIPGGAMIDRLGARRVMAVFGVLVIFVSPLYPVMPWMASLVVLQMVMGLSVSMNWIATQSLIGQRMKGDAVYAGRLAFATRIGGMVGPPIIGAIWDFVGPWGAFAFVSLWTSGLLGGLALLPKSAAERDHWPRPLRARDFAPRINAYGEALRMMAVAPAILLVVLVSILRQSGQGIQSSFYVVYLQGIDISATLIGSLLSAFLLVGAGGALAAGWLARLFNPYWLLMAAVALSIILIAITPLVGGVFVLLLLAIGARGGAIGVIQPVMLSLVAKAADPGDQGKAVGLRATANRLAMTVTPMIMGATVELVGIEDAFTLVGGVLLVALAAMAVYVRRTPAFRG